MDLDEWQSVSTILGQTEPEDDVQTIDEEEDPYAYRMDVLIRLVQELTKAIDRLDKRLVEVEQRQFRASINAQPRPLLWSLMGRL